MICARMRSCMSGFLFALMSVAMPKVLWLRNWFSSDLFTMRRKPSFAAFTAAASLMLIGGAEAKQDSVLYSFAGGTDAQNPLYESLCIDKNGNLYGTTDRGGANGLGTVFKIAPDGSETILHSFSGSDGSHPFGGVLADSAGSLYGTTSAGGSNDDGTVYKLASDGILTVLFSFGGGFEGDPMAGLLRDKRGNLYGTTAENYGTVFKLTPRGKYIVLHSFDDYNQDGEDPLGNLIMDGSDSLYGVTNSGGLNGWGTVFKIAADDTFTVLHAFSGGTDGGYPEAGLVMDAAGNLFGTTVAGGGSGQYGTVFKITPDGTETILTDFGRSGYFPAATLVLDGAGNLYGTTKYGGSTVNCSDGCGSVFQLAFGGTLRFLNKFQGGTADGAWPFGGVILHKGYLFGTTYGGGTSQVGTVFQLKK